MTWWKPGRLDPSTPFGGELREGRVYGRGACDMKGGIAASVIAAEGDFRHLPDFAGAIEISGHGRRGVGRLRRGSPYLAERG